MRRPIIFAVMDYLEAKCPELGIPIPKLEWLEMEGISLAVVQRDQPTIEKAYINGVKEYRIGFDVLEQAKVSDRLEVIQHLTKLESLFEDIDNTDLGNGITARKAETTTPSLDAQTENLRLRYRFNVTLFVRG